MEVFTMDRVKRLKMFLWSILGLAASVGITRFFFGIGSVTNLSDNTPWGLWIGFDVVSGVALAAGGFVITATVYIFGKDEFHPIVRPAVLTAFLGYLAVVTGLLFDLGLPWNIWHMIIYWQHHSPLFEVGWCVMLYSGVLLLEFSPVPLEETSRYAKIRAFLMKFRLVFVIAGIMLSTLHQSSLGSLFLIVPYKIHQLWHTPILPILFLVSAIGLGLMMVSLESLVTSYLYRRKPELHLISKLGRAAAWVLGIYFAIRFADIFYRGKAVLILDGSWESKLFIAEILFAVIIPIILLSISKIRNSLTGMWVGSIMVVVGFVFNRINTSGISMISSTEAYFPSWMEIAISAGVVSAAILVFLFAIEHFNIWESKPRDEEFSPNTQAIFDRSSESWLGEPGYSGRIKYSLAFIIAASIGFALIPGNKVNSEGIDKVYAQKARGGDTLTIDGNRDLKAVAFPHKAHIDSLGVDESCSKCHHMNIPLDKNSECYHCHSNMYELSDAFKHDWHSSPDGANIYCYECHTEGMYKTAEQVKKCEDCHKDLIPAEAVITIEKYSTPGYVDAMHGLCVDCHKKKDAEKEEDRLSLCVSCHKNEVKDETAMDYQYYFQKINSNWISLPIYNDKNDSE